MIHAPVHEPSPSLGQELETIYAPVHIPGRVDEVNLRHVYMHGALWFNQTKGDSMAEWFLGAIGFSYPEWKGSFYPAGLPANQSLAHYSKYFNAVEINTTFYGPKSPAEVQRWANSVPDSFRFCLKTPRRVTHDLRLQNTGPEMRAFLESSAALGEKFGAVLIQLPPSFKRGEQPVLEAFLETLPRETRFAIEFRHASWHVPETTDLLRRYGVCWAATDYEDLPVEIYPTAGFLYICWIGRHNVIPHPGHEVLDRTERLQQWLERIRANLDGIDAIFGFFDNDYAGHAPATLNRMRALVGLPVIPPSTEGQGRLF